MPDTPIKPPNKSVDELTNDIAIKIINDLIKILAILRAENEILKK